MTLSTFDNNDEGWILAGGNLYWNNSGGNPGGFIVAEDSINTYMNIAAPPKFLGNLSNFNGGTISFDAIEMENILEPYPSFGLITITSNSNSVSKDLAPDPLPWSWTHYSTTLSAEEWGVSEFEWKEILSNVTEITINLESGMFVGAETVGVDNIMLKSNPVCTPAINLLLIP